MAKRIYVLECEVTIGNLLFRNVQSIEIKSFYNELTDTATVQLPRNLSLKGKSVKEWIKVEDPVSIKLGYNGNLIEEFTGYVREIDPDIPLVIYCEDEMYKLKRGAITKSWASVTLKELLRHIAPSYQVETLDMQLGKFQINGASPAKVLEELREQYRLFSYFKGKKLCVGFAYQFSDIKRHLYDFQRNVRDSSLKYKTAENVKLRVKAIANPPKGKKIIVELGEKDGDLRTLNFGNLTKEELTRQAQEEMKRFKYDGYRGSISGWGLPVTRHGDLLMIRNRQYPERDGKYFINGVTIKFDDNGFERNNEIGPKG